MSGDVDMETYSFLDQFSVRPFLHKSRNLFSDFGQGNMVVRNIVDHTIINLPISSMTTKVQAAELTSKMKGAGSFRLDSSFALSLMIFESVAT